MMHRTQYRARTFLVAALVASFPSIAPCEILQTFNDRETGISVMVPAGYSVSYDPASRKDNLAIRLTSKDPTAEYCLLRFTRTTVPDKWARDKSKRTLHEQFRIVESTEQLRTIERRSEWRLEPFDPKLFLTPSPKSSPPMPMPPPPQPLPSTAPMQLKVLNVKLRSLFNYIEIICSAKIEEYDKQRATFEAVIKSVNIPY